MLKSTVKSPVASCSILPVIVLDAFLITVIIVVEISKNPTTAKDIIKFKFLAVFA
ncbi:hypothetical protein D3C75_1314080 [compost metagenome]